MIKVSAIYDSANGLIVGKRVEDCRKIDVRVALRAE